MRNKTEAAKILLDAGWTYEEVKRVLSGTDQEAPNPYKAEPYYPSRYVWSSDPTPPFFNISETL